MQTAIKTTRFTIKIEPAPGGINLFVPIEPYVLVNRSCPELLIRVHQALLEYLNVITFEHLPIIA